MQSSPTLKRDIVDLFDNVSKQAEEYIDMFNVLRRKTREIEGLRTDMQRHLDEFRLECSEEIASSKHSVEHTLQDLQARLDFVREVHGEMDAIHQLKEALQELRASYKNRNSELDIIVKSIHGYLRSETETEFLAQEKKLAFKVQSMESHLMSFDARIQNLQDSHRREFRDISEEVNKFRNKVTETRNIVDEATKKVNDSVEEADRSLQEKIQTYAVEVEHRIGEIISTISGDNAPKVKIDKLRSDLASLDKRVRGFDQRAFFRASIGIGIGSLALLLSVLILVLR